MHSAYFFFNLRDCVISLLGTVKLNLCQFYGNGGKRKLQNNNLNIKGLWILAELDTSKMETDTY